jgi:hypothetical protein
VVIIPVVLGAMLALAPSSGSTFVRPIRAFSFTASWAVILLHLLPESFASIGVGSVAMFAGGLSVPALLNRLAARTHPALSSETGKPRSPLVGLEAGYLGLLVHRFGDGLALGAVGGSLSFGYALVSVYVALAAHSVPVVAAATLAFVTAHGRRVGLVRAFGLAVAGVLGVAATSLVPFDSFHRAAGWVGAVVAGLLAHVVSHDARELATPWPAGRGPTLAAAAAGVGLGALAAVIH